MKSLEQSIILESFWTLQSNLQLLNNATPPKSILVTSIGPQEGKSTIVSNLAVTLSKVDKKVLLVDADLRHPALHKIFNLANDIGLADLLSGTVKDIFSPIIHPYLTLLTSGHQPSNPPKLINSDAMKGLIKKTTSLYDFVLLDSPPVLAVIDAVLLTSLVEGVILVLNTGKSTDGEAKKTKFLLEKAGARILGTILNNFDDKPGGDGYYPYRYVYVE